MNDTEIINLYWERNQTAITVTQDKYGKYCYTIAFNILSNNEDSEECVNDTYLETWNSIPPKRPDNLKAYVGKLTRNNALNRYEKNTAVKRGGGETLACLDELVDCVSSTNNIEEAENYNYLVTCLNKFLSLLIEDQRIIFVKRYFYCCSIHEIAKDCGFTESKVKTTLSRLRLQLRNYLKGEGIEV